MAILIYNTSVFTDKPKPYVLTFGRRCYCINMWTGELSTGGRWAGIINSQWEVLGNLEEKD